MYIVYIILLHIGKSHKRTFNFFNELVNLKLTSMTIQVHFITFFNLWCDGHWEVNIENNFCQ